MKGHIRQRSKGSWSIALYLGKSPEGKKRYKWSSIRGTKKDAQRELTRLLHSMQAGIYCEPSRMTVGEYLEHWLKAYAEANVAGSTLQRYEIIVRNHLVAGLGSIELVKLQPLHIQQLYSKRLRDLSPTTVVQCHRILRQALKHAVQWQLIARNPTDAVKPPRKKRVEFQVLSEEQTVELLKVVRGTRLHIPVLLAASTGMRRGEVLALKWSDIDLKSATMNVRRTLEHTKIRGLVFKDPKSAKSRRSISLPRFAVAELRVYKREQSEARLKLGPAYRNHDLVCPAPDGRPLVPDRVSEAFRDCVHRSELPRVRFHDLRHSHATHLLRQNVNPKVVSERLGHSSVSITLDLYSHVLPSMQIEAAGKIDEAIGMAMLKTQQS